MILAFDTETTGVDITKDRPVQISLVQHGNPSRVLFNSFCNPLMEVEKGAVEVHGITPDKYENAPDFMAAIWNLSLLLDQLQGAIIVSYNGSIFDIPLVNNCIGKDIFPNLRSLDLYSVVMRYLPELKSFKLPNVYQELIGEEAPNAHNAVSDCINCLKVLDKLCAKTGKTPEALAEEMREPKPLLIMPFSKHHKGKMMNEVPRGFAKWLLDQNVGKPMQADIRLSMEMIMDGSIHDFFREAA